MAAFREVWLRGRRHLGRKPPAPPGGAGAGRSKPLRIVLLQAALWADSGATRVNLDLAKGWFAAGHDVRVIALKSLTSNEASSSPVPVRFLSHDQQGERWPKTVARLAAACRGADVIVGGSEADRSLIYGCAAARLVRRPFVVIVHLSPSYSIPIFTPPEIRSATRRAFRFCWGAVCVSPDLESEVASLGVRRDRVVTVANGIDVRGLSARAEAARSCLDEPNVPTIVGVGRLAEAKGFDVLIRAHARLLSKGVRCRLTIMGEGPARRSLEQLVTDLAVSESVELSGFISDVVPGIAAASVTCLSSRSEGLPLVILESLAMGTPVIATNCSDAVRDFLEGGAYGDIVAVDSVDGLVDALHRHLRDPSLLRAKAAAARAHMDYYSTDRMCADYIAWFTRFV